MGIFDMFGKRPGIDEGVERFHATAGAILLDVRTQQEYHQGHIPQSVNIPLDHLSELSHPKTTPLFVYCQSGARSSQAYSWLKQHGYGQVTDLGGIMGYHGALEQ